MLIVLVAGQADWRADSAVMIVASSSAYAAIGLFVKPEVGINASA
jgi:hypothetical protein